MKHLLSYFLVLLLVVACKPSRPDGILSPGEMEDILYDMHKAQALYDEGEMQKDQASIIAMRANVLEKYDVDKAEWDSSYNYYCRNSDQFYSIYLALSERIDDDVVALGGKVNGMEGADADTANVWHQESSFVLMHQAPYNVVSFSIDPDSTFQDGDRLTLQYDTRFLFQEGYRDLTVYMAVYYSNDSIATQVTHTTSDGQGVLTIMNDVDRLHVTKIKGFFLLTQNIMDNGTNLNSSMLHVCCLTNVKLLHLKTMPPAKPSGAPMHRPDSLNKDSMLSDSIKKQHNIRVGLREEMLRNSVVN